MRNCPFCQINPDDQKVIKETKFSWVVFSNPRLMSGHLLIIPKRHVEKIGELLDNEKEDLWKNLVEFQEKILEKVALGCDVRQNYRPFQKEGKLRVHHLHFHLQPRELFDDLYEKCQKYESNIFKELNEEEVDWEAFIDKS